MGCTYGNKFCRLVARVDQVPEDRIRQLWKLFRSGVEIFVDKF